MGIPVPIQRVPEDSSPNANHSNCHESIWRLNEQSMCIKDLLGAAGSHSALLGAVWLCVPIAAWCLSFFRRGKAAETSPYNYLYAVLIYVTCIPGLLAATVVAYSLFFTNENLLGTDLLVTLVPILSMGVTLGIIRNTVNTRSLPGFQRLSSLIVVMFLSFLGALMIKKSSMLLVFHGSVPALVLFAAIVFVLLNTAFRSMVGGRPKKTPTS